MARSSAAKAETPPPRNAFDLAQPVVTVTAQQAKDRTVQRPTVGLKNHTALCVVKKIVDALIKTGAPEIHTQMNAYFVPEGCRLGQTPANYEGIEGDARASLQMKKKSSNQPLTVEEVAVLREAGITVGRNLLVPKSYIINPDHMGNPLLMKVVGEMIGKMLGQEVQVDGPNGKETVTVPDDIFNIQFEEATDIVADESLDDIFRLYGKKPQVAKMLVEICSYLAINPEWKGDPKDAATLARDIIFQDDAKPVEERAETRAKEMEKQAEQRKKSITGSRKKKK